MIMDYQQLNMDALFAAYPNWTWEDTPVQPDQIHEHLYLQGTNTGRSLTITGTADQQE